MAKILEQTDRDVARSVNRALGVSDGAPAFDTARWQARLGELLAAHHSEEWARLRSHLPKSGQRGGRWGSHRRIINGLLSRNRTGVPWRDLPARFGKWKTPALRGTLAAD